MAKQVWSTVTGLTAAALSIGTPFVFLWIKYGTLFRERQGWAFVTSGVVLAIVLAVLWVMNFLKELAETGRPMERKVAREIRFVIPLMVILSVLSVIHFDIGNMVAIIGVSLVANLVAVPLRVVSYRLGKRYEADMASINSLSAIQKLTLELEKQNAKPRQSKTTVRKAKADSVK